MLFFYQTDFTQQLQLHQDKHNNNKLNAMECLWVNWAFSLLVFQLTTTTFVDEKNNECLFTCHHTNLQTGFKAYYNSDCLDIGWKIWLSFHTITFVPIDWHTLTHLIVISSVRHLISAARWNTPSVCFIFCEHTNKLLKIQNSPEVEKGLFLLERVLFYCIDQLIL